MIAGGCLAAKDKRARLNIHIWIVLETMIQRNHMKDVEMLAFVFVNAFDWAIKNGMGVDFDAIGSADITCQPGFVVGFDLLPLGTKVGIIDEGFEFLEMIQVLNPSIPYAICDEL